MRYQVLILICMGMIISLSAMNCEYVSRFSESNTSSNLNNMIIDSGRLYLCKEYGVDLFEIEDSGELTLLSTIQVDDVRNFTIYNNKLYFACYPFGGDTWDTTIYKYDVSNPMQPVETGQFELDYPPYSMYIWHDMLTIIDFILTRQLLYYDPETLEYIDCEEGEFLKPFYGEYWCNNDPDILTIYDLSDPFNTEVVTTVDLEPINNDRSHVCRRISEELYVVYSQLEMSLWDTSDFNNWQLLSQFLFPVNEFLFYDLNIVIWDDKILLPLVEELLVVDINDPELPDVSQILYPDLINPSNCKKYGDHIYLVDNNFGIQILDIDENEVELGEVCTEYPKQLHGMRYDDYVLCESYNSIQGLPDYYLWNISSPEAPVLSGELDLGTGRSGGKILDNYLIIKNEENLNIEFYDISNLPEIAYVNSIDCFENLFEFLYGNFYLADDNIDKIFIKIPTNRIVCYDISDIMNIEELYEIIEEDYYILSQQEDYLYLCDSSTGSDRDMKIYSGIESNNPQLAAHYQNIFPEHFTIKTLENKLFISNSYDDYSTQVYELNGSEIPVFICNLYTDFSGRVYYYGGEYIVCSIHEANVFNIPGNPPEFLEPASHIGRFNFICNMEVINSGSEDYLYIFDGAYTEVYQVESTENDENLVTETIKMITYPNPFSFENCKDITFYSQNALSRYCEDALLSVYNIKGQLVHRQEIDFTRDSSLQWNCRLGNGIKAPSGVYLYKVNAGDESSAGKFIITK